MKFPAFFRPIAACSLATLLAACPPTDDPTDDPTDTGPVTLRQLAEALVTATETCTPISTFFKELEPNYQIGIGVNADDLLARLEEQEGHPAYGPLDQQALDDCFASMNSNPELCEDLISESCRNLFPGIVAEGDTCDANHQCIDGLGCLFDADCGTCAPLLAVGDSCATDVVGVCNRSAGEYCENELCQAAEPDASELEFAVGDSCDENTKCGLWFSSGLVCVESVCAAVEVGTAGDACDFYAIAGTATRACRGSLLSRELFCEVSAAGNEAGTCAETKAVGAECILDYDCQSDLECTDSVCTEIPPECATNNDCNSGETCEQGICENVEEESMCFAEAT